MYEDEFQIYELLDKWNGMGPPSPIGVSALFTEKPLAAKHIFAYGQTLLHKCMQTYSNRLDLIEIFSKAHPQALLHSDNEGYLPLHRALAAQDRSTNLEIIKFLLGKAPETIQESTHSGQFPLHIACGHCTIDVVKFLAESFPEVLQYRDRNGKFPLDHALERNEINMDVLKFLLDKHSVLLSFTDDYGSLTLHRMLARNHRQFDEVIEVLIEYCPGALRFQDNRGRTPLMQACSMNNSLSQVYALVRNWPEQVSTKAGVLFYETSFNGELMPSSLVSKSSSLAQAKLWVERYPHSLHTLDSEGRYPIHYAAVSRSKDAASIIHFLQRSNIGSVSKPDKFGRLPIHYASATPFCSENLAKSLIDAFPDGLRHVDNDGRLPWHYADCARNGLIYDKTFELCPDLETDLDYVPDEIRWDIVQVIPDNN